MKTALRKPPPTSVRVKADDLITAFVILEASAKNSLEAINWLCDPEGFMPIGEFERDASLFDYAAKQLAIAQRFRKAAGCPKK